MSSLKFDPDWVIAPGETLWDWCKETGTAPDEAQAFGITEEQFDRLLSGEEEIDGELAQKLAHFTKISVSFWLALEHNFRAGLAAGKTWVPERLR